MQYEFRVADEVPIFWFSYVKFRSQRSQRVQVLLWPHKNRLVDTVVVVIVALVLRPIFCKRVDVLVLVQEVKVKVLLPLQSELEGRKRRRRRRKSRRWRCWLQKEQVPAPAELLVS